MSERYAAVLKFVINSWMFVFLSVFCKPVCTSKAFLSLNSFKNIKIYILPGNNHFLSVITNHLIHFGIQCHPSLVCAVLSISCAIFTTTLGKTRNSCYFSMWFACHFDIPLAVVMFVVKLKYRGKPMTAELDQTKSPKVRCWVMKSLICNNVDQMFT